MGGPVLVLPPPSSSDGLGKCADHAVRAVGALFVPRYWNPPSLLGLAQRTGFDIESLIFCFGMSGVCTVRYNVVTARELQPVARQERHARRHRHHRAALLVPAMAFPALWLLQWNPIYSAILALSLGGAATVACRRDLTRTTVLGGLLFLGYYAVFMFLLVWSVPGYVDRVWNLPALSGVLIGGVPLEELMFGFAFGTYWSAIYEHLTWQRPGTAYRHPATSQRGPVCGKGSARSTKFGRRQPIRWGRRWPYMKHRGRMHERMPASSERQRGLLL